MEYIKMTVSIPKYVHSLLLNKVPKGKRSQLVARSIERSLLGEPDDILGQISNLREQVLHHKSKTSVDTAIKKGRH